jgi:hypothetical protein
VYGSTSDNRIAFLYGNDVAYGGSGNDELYGSHGGDVFIGGPGNDTLDGGPDIDILIGGSGNDAFIIDMDCEVEPGDIVDGGGGTDTVYSHRSQGELTAMGVTFVSIEQFVVIEHDSDTVKCEPFPYDGGPIWQPRVKLTWDDVPTPATVTTTTSGILHLSVLNTGSTAVTAEIGLRLWARGFSSPLLIDPVNLAASGSSGDRDSIEVDLNDFIPGGTDLQSVDPAWLELPVSARLYAVARVKTATGAGVAETPKAMPLFGHLEGSTAVIYGPAALQEVYNGGDLAHITSVPQPASVFRGAIEAHGSLAVQ